MTAAVSILGEVRGWLREVCVVLGLSWAALTRGLSPATWTPARRRALAEQIHQVGVGALPSVAVISPIIGAVLVPQALFWLRRLGATELFGDLFVFVVINELAPLLVSFLVIARSGSVMAGEMAFLSRTAPAPGDEPRDVLLDWVLPRVLGMAISIVCLCVLFVAFALLGGALLGTLGGDNQVDDYAEFLVPVLRSLDVGNVLAFILMVVPIALITPAVCCFEGLAAQRAAGQGGRAASRAVLRSVAVVVLIMGTVTILGTTGDASPIRWVDAGTLEDA